MKYLHVKSDGGTSVTETEPDQTVAGEVYDGDVQVFKFEGDTFHMLQADGGVEPEGEEDGVEPEIASFELSWIPV